MAGQPLPIPTSEPVLSIADLKTEADKNLDPLIREFYNSGSTDQRTLLANEAAYTRFHLRSRVLVNIKGLDTTSSCLGNRVRFPLGTAPAGIQAAAHSDGELATSRAITKFGVNQAISSYASFTAKEIIDAGRDVTANPGEAKIETRLGGDYVMQMYPMRDRALQERILKNAEDAGCKAVFVTGDSPVFGYRYNEHRNDFRSPEGISYPILEKTSKMIRETTHDSGFYSMNDDSATFDSEIQWLKERTKMKILVKGVMTGEDVSRAIDAGCDGVVVSNHGGRQLDGVAGTMDVLSECVRAAKRAGPNFEVHVDGGVRRGSDIFMAVALGAKCVWVGRPVLWGLAYKGEAGVQRMLEVLYEDFRRCMALCGCRTVEDINRSCLSRFGADGVLRPLPLEDPEA